MAWCCNPRCLAHSSWNLNACLGSSETLRIEQNDMQTNLTGLDDHTSSALGVVAGPMGNLLEQNYLILNQYKQNMQQYKVHENTDLLVRFRDNIVTILSQMNCMSGEFWPQILAMLAAPWPWRGLHMWSLVKFLVSYQSCLVSSSV